MPHHAMPRTAVVVVLSLLAAGCGLGRDATTGDGAQPARTQLPPAPKPQYAPGDTFLYTDNGVLVQEQVISVTPDRATWTNDRGLVWSTDFNVVTPPLSWSSDPEIGRGRQEIVGSPEQIFPLAQGKRVAFGVRGRSELAPGGWQDEHSCTVAGQEEVKVSAGTFQAYRIDCRRKDHADILYYSPVVQNVVLRSRDFAGGTQRKELVSYKLAADRPGEMATAGQGDVVAKGEPAATGAPAGSMAKPVTAEPMGDRPVGTARMPLEERLGTVATRLEQAVDRLEKVGETMAARPPSGQAARPPARTPAAGGAAAGGGWGVHLASFRSVPAAQRGWADLQKKLPALGPLTMRTAEFDPGDGRGTFIRLIGAGLPSRDAAASLCSELKAQRQFCQPINLGG